MSLVLTGLLLWENGKRIKSFPDPNLGDCFQVVRHTSFGVCWGPRETDHWKQSKTLFVLILLYLKKYTSKGGNLKLPSKSVKEAWLSPVPRILSTEPISKTVANSNSSGMKYSDSWFHLPLSFVTDRFSFLGVSIWFLLDRNAQRALFLGI